MLAIYSAEIVKNQFCLDCRVFRNHEIADNHPGSIRRYANCQRISGILQCRTDSNQSFSLLVIQIDKVTLRIRKYCRYYAVLSHLHTLNRKIRCQLSALAELIKDIQCTCAAVSCRNVTSGRRYDWIIHLIGLVPDHIPALVRQSNTIVAVADHAVFIDLVGGRCIVTAHDFAHYLVRMVYPAALDYRINQNNGKNHNAGNQNAF